MVGLNISELRERKDLWYRFHVFVFDLRHFTAKVDSQNRIDSVIPSDQSHLGKPYFTDDEVAILKELDINGEGKTLLAAVEEVLTERLERRMKKRVESADYRVCTAHDLAPIYEKALGINQKDLERDEHFLRLVEESGLHLKDGQNWDDPRKKSFKPAKGKKRRHSKCRGGTSSPEQGQKRLKKQASRSLGQQGEASS